MIKGNGDLLNRAAHLNHLHGAGSVAGPFHRRDLIAMLQAQSTAATRHLNQALSALRHRIYRLYWFGPLASVMEQNMGCVARTWLMLELTNSPFLLGLRSLSQVIPTFTLTLVGRAVASTVAEFGGAPIAGNIGGVLVSGAALRMVLTKLKLQRLEPQLAFDEMRASM